MITADWHIPLYDPHLVNKMILEARKLKINQLIIAGDFFNFDSLSSYDPKQSDAGLEREHKEGLAVIKTLLETFKRIYYPRGNHDYRFARALGFKMQFAVAIRAFLGELGEELLDRIEFTNLDHVYARPYPFAPDNESWYVCHPKAYSRTPLVGARALASKHAMNVITAHSHHCAIGPGVARGSVVAEAGGLFDEHKTQYLQDSTTFPHWAQGYAYLDENNHITVRSPRWSAL